MAAAGYCLRHASVQPSPGQGTSHTTASQLSAVVRDRSTRRAHAQQYCFRTSGPALPQQLHLPGRFSQFSGRQQPHRRQVPQCAAASQLSELISAVQVAPGRDIAAMLASGIGAWIWVKLFDYLARYEILEQKLSRKLVHITAGPLFVLTWPFFSSAPDARLYAAVVPLLQSLRLLLIGFGFIEGENTVRAVSREGDRRELLRGPLYYVLILTAVTLLYWRESPAGLLVVALMCGGDGMADIIGRRFGRGSKLPHNSNKSWAGSAAMFAGGITMSMVYTMLFAHLGYFSYDLGKALPAIAAISAAATAMESLPINQTVDDNLSVPGIAAVLGYFALRTL